MKFRLVPVLLFVMLAGLPACTQESPQAAAPAGAVADTALAVAAPASAESGPIPLANVVPPLESDEHKTTPRGETQPALPIEAPAFVNHVRNYQLEPEDSVDALGTDKKGFIVALQGDTVLLVDNKDLKEAAHVPADMPAGWQKLGPRARLALLIETNFVAPTDARMFPSLDETINDIAQDGSTYYYATDNGLYAADKSTGKTARHAQYGVDGPLATRITAVATDSKGTLWVGTPLGLSRRDNDGKWTQIRGREGLPFEDITAIALDQNDRLWIGTSHGAIQYRPYEEGRQWYYREGERYLPGNAVHAVATTPDGSSVFFATNSGVGRMDAVTTTLLEKAQSIEDRVNERHRRLGLVAGCTLDDPYNPTSHTIGDNDNDGLWTAYHVAAMSLAYGATGDEKAKASAKESMDAVYMLQNASGTPGLVARSVVPLDIGKTKNEQWRLTPDGDMYWKSDTSSDEIDGHYLAFYTYWEHIAKDDPEEAALLEKQVRALTDYLVDNNYQLIDWDGERTRWGIWNPESLNDGEEHYLENGLNSLQMLSFLKVAYYITDDEKYQDHYMHLIRDHRYLSNALLTKKLFPDELNQSDDQLGFVAWYPILQIEHDPEIRRALHQGVRRHAKVEKMERSPFFNFVYATIDPEDADVAGGILTLEEMPEDRRSWRQENSHRDDVHFSARPNRFGRPILDHLLPADEREFDKWNGDPFEPDGGGDGRHEDDGAAYLLPYWMGRFHGLLTEAN